ncbi:MAG TPA: cobalamin-binding protein, partial [Lapillicoccus sp.]|nr:cobalamin-binding protein [Lapillicoccus sp.]
MRIVSLLPSTTEILFAVGAGDDVVGVTFECDYPTEARTRRIVSTSALPEGLGAAEIDRVVSERMRAGEDLYHLDEGALAGLDADLVVTQDLCAVCAVDVSVVDEALAHLGCRADVLTIDPHTLDEVLASVVTLGRSSGRVDEA